MGDVVQLRSSIPTGGDINEYQIPRGEIRTDQDTLISRPTESVSTAELYSAPEALDPRLGTILRLLGEATTRLDEAVGYYRSGDLMMADDEISRFRVLLPELFVCASIAEGFRAMVTAIHYGLVNCRGEPLQELQLVALQKAIQRLNTEPFMTFNDAVDQQLLLEESGFIVEPAELDLISDLLNE